MNNLPIGVFDSGIGGLTVVKEIAKMLPHESIIYLGDTARVPYGTRGKEVIRDFALEMTRFVLAQDVKALVVACNTISATCLPAIQKVSPVPVIGVIKPTVEEAVAQTKGKVIGVMGTNATIATRVYEKEIHKLNNKIQVTTQSSPLLVPLAEGGYLTHDATRLIVKDYLLTIKKKRPETLILGCTHYPLLKKIIQEEIGLEVKVIDSAKPTATELKKILTEKDLLTTQGKPTYKFLVTDLPDQTTTIANMFLEYSFPIKLQKITLH